MAHTLFTFNKLPYIINNYTLTINNYTLIYSVSLHC